MHMKPKQQLSQAQLQNNAREETPFTKQEIAQDSSPGPHTLPWRGRIRSARLLHGLWRLSRPAVQKDNDRKPIITYNRRYVLMMENGTVQHMGI